MSLFHYTAHGSTGAALHINQPKTGPSTSINTQANKNLMGGFRVRERTVARSVLCKQTAVNFRGLLPEQRAHAEGHCFFYSKLVLTHTQVVYRPQRSCKAAVKAAQAVASFSDHLPMLTDGETLVEGFRKRHTRAARYI